MMQRPYEKLNRTLKVYLGIKTAKPNAVAQASSQLQHQPLSNRSLVDPSIPVGGSGAGTTAAAIHYQSTK